MTERIHDEELSALIDGALDPAREAEVREIAARTPEVAARHLERLRRIVRHVRGSREVRTDRPAEAIAAEIAHEVAALMESRCEA